MGVQESAKGVWLRHPNFSWSAVDSSKAGMLDNHGMPRLGDLQAI